MPEIAFNAYTPMQVVMEYVAKMIASKGYAIIVVEDGAAEELVSLHLPGPKFIMG